MFFQILLILLFPLYLFADENVLVNNFLNFLPNDTGYLLMSEGENVIIDMGKSKNTFEGVVLDVFRSSKTVLHPITGEVLAQTKEKIGQIQISEVYEKYSEAKIIDKKTDFMAGDYVKVSLPYKVKVEYFDLDKITITRIEDLLFKGGLMVKDPASPFSLNIHSDKELGLSLNFLYFNKTITSLYSTKLTLNEEKSPGTSFKEKFDKGYQFLAVCNLGSKKNEILLADEERLDVYNFLSDKIEYSGKIDEKFNKIIGIDCSDVDKNGSDEIFITISDGGKGIKSYIYIQDKGKFILLKDNFPFVIRTVLLNGEKKAVIQRLTRDGKFMGRINFLEFNGEYVKGSDIPDTTNFSIYGFGLGDVNADGIIDILRVNEKSNLEIYSKGKKIYESVDKYGDSTFYFIMKQRVLVENVTNKESENRLEELKSRVYLNDRIFVDKSGKIWTGKVVKSENIIPTFEKYFNKITTVSRFTGNMLKTEWSSGDMGVNVADFYIFEDSGKTYVLNLKNNKGVGFWSKSSSELVINELGE